MKKGFIPPFLVNFAEEQESLAIVYAIPKNLKRKNPLLFHYLEDVSKIELFELQFGLNITTCESIPTKFMELVTGKPK